VANDKFTTGVWTATLTPLNSDLSIDNGLLIEHCQSLIGDGCHGVGLFGTTGEAVSFSVAERQQSLEAMLKAGIAPESIMVGAGCCALTDSIALAQHAVSNGCNNVLMLPPFYYKDMGDEGLARSFGEVIERVGSDAMQVFLYHFPRLSGVPITAGLVALLTERYPGTVAGLKDSGGDYDNMLAMTKQFPNMNIFPGSERFLLQGLRAGMAGCITASGNMNPAGIRKVWDSFAADGDDADACQEAATAKRSVIEKFPLVTGQKGLKAREQNHPGWTRVRPPMLEIGETELDQLAAGLSALS